RYVKTPGQTHFYFLSEKILGWPMTEPHAFKKFAKEECPRGQHIRIYYVGETAARKLGRRSVRAGHFLVRARGHSRGCDNNWGLSRRLRASRLIASRNQQKCTCNQTPSNSINERRFPHNTSDHYRLVILLARQIYRAAPYIKIRPRLADSLITVL